MIAVNDKDKLACAKRELQYRRYVYKRRVQNGQMTEVQAQREIELMSAIVEDYAKIVAALQPELFDENDDADHDDEMPA